MELNYNRDLLKSLLTQLSSIDSACKMMKADKVVVFHSKYRSIVKDEPTESTVPYYNELASSEFVIENQDEEIKKKFEQIKEQIKKQLQEQSAKEI
jgi:predicted ATP-grasp superfamily ATP-dependent carboligase